MVLPSQDELSLLFQKSLDEHEKAKLRAHECAILHQTLSGIMKKKDGKPATFGMTKRELPNVMIQEIWDDCYIKAKELGLVQSKD